MGKGHCTCTSRSVEPCSYCMRDEDECDVIAIDRVRYVDNGWCWICGECDGKHTLDCLDCEARS